MKEQFINFLEGLDNNDNKLLLEHIKEGFKVFLESNEPIWFTLPGTNLVTSEMEHQSALDKYNTMGANSAAEMGIGVLQFLRNSAKTRENMFSEDLEPELDGIYTSGQEDGGVEFSVELGLTKNIPTRYKEQSLGIDFNQI